MAIKTFPNMAGTNFALVKPSLVWPLQDTYPFMASNCGMKLDTLRRQNKNILEYSTLNTVCLPCLSIPIVWKQNKEAKMMKLFER